LREVAPLTGERARLLQRLEAAATPADARDTASYLRRITPVTYLANLRQQPAEIQVAFLARLIERVEVTGSSLRFLPRFGLPEWTMVLPPRWETQRTVGFFPLPDGSRVSGRSPRESA
jgi:hypothetical protein